MLHRCLFASLALLILTTDSDAGPLRRRAQSTYQPSFQPTYQPYYQPTYQPAFQPVVEPSISSTPAVIPAGGYTASYTPVVTASAPSAVASAGAFGGDGLDEVNAKRASRGLRPFIRDEALTQAAHACAAFRAERGLFGHTSNDFGFLPPGSTAASAGCAAYPASYGWMSCCTYEGYTFAGAAWVTGQDGRRYMHLYVR